VVSASLKHCAKPASVTEDNDFPLYKNIDFVYKFFSLALAGGEGVLLAKDSSVGPRARLQHCCLGAGATVAVDCRLASCVLMEGARVGRFVELTKVILGRGAEVAEGAKVGLRCLLGDGVLV
jgi:NDP-sugar pyrophosphorylase family protein